MNAESYSRFAAQLRGSIIRPGDQDYDESRAVYNAMHDRHPLMIRMLWMRTMDPNFKN